MSCRSRDPAPDGRTIMKGRDIRVGDMKSRYDGGYVQRVTTSEVVADRTRSAVASGQAIAFANDCLRRFFGKRMISVIRFNTM